MLKVLGNNNDKKKKKNSRESIPEVEVRAHKIQNYKFVDNPNDTDYKAYVDSLYNYNLVEKAQAKLKHRLENESISTDEFRSALDISSMLRFNDEGIAIGEDVNAPNVVLAESQFPISSGNKTSYHKLYKHSFTKPKHKVFLKGTPEYDNAKKQEALGIIVDGVWGPKSQAALDNANPVVEEKKETVVNKKSPIVKEKAASINTGNSKFLAVGRDYYQEFNGKTKVGSPFHKSEYESRTGKKLKVLGNNVKAYQSGGILRDARYLEFESSFPPSASGLISDDYDMRYYWENHGKPKNFKEAIDNEMFTYEDDKKWHGPSVESNTGRFLKKSNHPTIDKELDWFYKSKDENAVKFREENDLELDGYYYKYVPKNISTKSNNNLFNKYIDLISSKKGIDKNNFSKALESFTKWTSYAESSDNNDARPYIKGNTSRGYFQFNDASIDTVKNRIRNVKKAVEKNGETIKLDPWINDFLEGKKDIKDLDYDQQAFVFKINYLEDPDSRSEELLDSNNFHRQYAFHHRDENVINNYKKTGKIDFKLANDKNILTNLDRTDKEFKTKK